MTMRTGWMAGLAILMAAARPALAQEDGWTSLGLTTNDETVSIDTKHARTITNELGVKVLRLFVRIDLPRPNSNSTIRRVTDYEVDCAGRAARVVGGTSYDAAGAVTDRYAVPSDNPMKTVGEGNMATKIYNTLCGTAS